MGSSNSSTLACHGFSNELEEEEVEDLPLVVVEVAVDATSSSSTSRESAKAEKSASLLAEVEECNAKAGRTVAVGTT